MEKIIYLTFFCFILVFAFGCKTEKIQKKQKTIEKKTTDNSNFNTIRSIAAGLDFKTAHS